MIKNDMYIYIYKELSGKIRKNCFWLKGYLEMPTDKKLRRKLICIANIFRYTLRVSV